MPIEEPKMQPWQVFSAAVKYLGASSVAKIFNRELRSAYSWAQDPECTECRCRNPLELLHTLFVRLDAIGFGYVARDAITYLQTAIDPEVEVGGPVKGLLPTIGDQELEDYKEIADLHRAIDAGSSIEYVLDLEKALLSQIERTVARYRKDTGHDC